MGEKEGEVEDLTERIVQAVRGVQLFQIAQQANNSSTEEYGEFCKSLTNDPAEAKAGGEALRTVTKDAEKMMKDKREETERD